jgi:hypothetical protein
MYTLQFSKNKSKDFNSALKFALELGGSYDGKNVKTTIDHDQLLIAYKMMRTLFGLVQKWKSTKAFYKGKEVHPYQFIFYMHRISECADLSEINKNNCLLIDGTLAWSCKKVDIINYQESGSGVYSDNKRYWYNFGSFKKSKWIIDKQLIKKKLLDFSYLKGLDICPFFDENSLINQVDNLPSFIYPDNVTFKIHFSEQYIDGIKVQIPNNIRHITDKNFSRLQVLTVVL